jgi:hypothetical protein
MRDPTADEKTRSAAAIEEARFLLARVAVGVVPAGNLDFDGALALMESVLNDPAADNLLGALAAPVRDVAIPMLRTGRPSKRPRPGRPDLVRNRVIAETVEYIRRRYGFEESRNPGSTHESACSIVTKALRQLKVRRLLETPEGKTKAVIVPHPIKLSERQVARIVKKHRI